MSFPRSEKEAVKSYHSLHSEEMTFRELTARHTETIFSNHYLQPKVECLFVWGFFFWSKLFYILDRNLEYLMIHTAIYVIYVTLYHKLSLAQEVM